MSWEDATNYSSNESFSERKPRAWRLKVTAHCVIWVGHEHIHHKGAWVVTCAPWFDALSLKMPADKFTAEQAQQRALGMVRVKVQKLSAALAGSR